ncbi:MAG: Coenzyme F420 hydrogenase/dehydrogenase, beta subunit C-terminal domain [bacterium]
MSAKFQSVRGMRSIEEVAERHLCAGCGVCAFLEPAAIRMVDDLDRGRRPVVQRGSESGRGLQACPGLRLEQAPALAGVDSSLRAGWGNVLAVWEGHSTDDEVRLKGSSGGAATALALWAIEATEMVGAVHIRAKPSQPVLNETTFSSDREALVSATGSRYSPASPADGLQQLVDSKGPGIFIGKPCDVAGAVAASRLEPALAEKLGLTVAIFCAGAPSTNATVDYIEQIGGPLLSDLRRLRYRGNGWPGVFKATGHDGFTVERSYEESWGVVQAKRPWRCRICPDHTGELADISVGDPWYRQPGEGEPGSSLIVARTERGKQAVEAAIASGFLECRVVDSSLVPASQPGLLLVKASVFGRLVAMSLQGIPTPLFSGFSLFRLWMTKLNLRRKLGSILGTIPRLRRWGVHQPLRIKPGELQSSAPEDKPSTTTQ